MMVVAGLAPASFLFAIGVAGLFVTDFDSLPMTVMFLTAALISGLIFVLLAYLLTAGIRRLKKPVAITLGLIIILSQAFEFGSDRLPAAQATALASTIDGIMGGDVPTQKYAAGALLGGVLSALVGGLGITVGLGVVVDDVGRLVGIVTKMDLVDHLTSMVSA